MLTFKMDGRVVFVACIVSTKAPKRGTKTWYNSSKDNRVFHHINKASWLFLGWWRTEEDSNPRPPDS